MLKEKDLNYQEPVLNKQQRAELKKAQEKDQKDAKVVKEKCLKFFNEELATLDIPLYLVDEVVKASFNVLFSIHKNKSKQYSEYLKAKANLEETNMNKLC